MSFSRSFIHGAALRAIPVLAIATTAFRASAQTTDSSFIDRWQARASASQAEQPHWVTPLATTTPRLEQELRYDLGSRTAPDGTNTTLYGNGKGLELIPFSAVELIIGAPGYTVHREAKVANGFGDMPLLLKYRILSSNESTGDDILTVFLGASLPTGGKVNGAGQTVLTPTIAGGQGWGAFDVQATLGVNLPTDGAKAIGHPLLYNVAAQYHASRFLWPELELNGTTWRDGTHVGMNQVFATPGIVFGRFPIHNRLGFTAGIGEQIAVSSYHQYDHAWILSLRMPF